MKNVLIPTDFSENSWNAIRYALNFFEKEHCNFYVLHVNSAKTGPKNSPSLPYIEEIDKRHPNSSKKQLRKVLTRITAEFPENKNHKFYTLTDDNFFITSIRKHIEEKKINLIVMGTKGASDGNELIIGSNTANVIVKVPCNTLIIPGKSKIIWIKRNCVPYRFFIVLWY